MNKAPKVDHTTLWRLITIFALLVTIGSVGVFAFQQRTPIVESLTSKKVFLRNDAAGPPSAQSAKEIDEFLKSNERIISMDVVRVNFKMNVRQTTHQITKDAGIDRVWKTSKDVQFPLFTENAKSNARVVSMINGQFVCSPTAETLVGRMYPAIGDASTTTCTVAIPPGFGDFVGWINIYLTEQPTFNQMVSLKKISEKLARDVYERDILKGKSSLRGMSNQA